MNQIRLIAKYIGYHFLEDKVAKKKSKSVAKVIKMNR